MYSMYLCYFMCVCMCVSIYLFYLMYVCMHVYECVCMYVCIHACVCMYVCVIKWVFVLYVFQSSCCITQTGIEDGLVFTFALQFTKVMASSERCGQYCFFQWLNEQIQMKMVEW